jgi:hypothetical protein
MEITIVYIVDSFLMLLCLLLFQGFLKMASGMFEIHLQSEVNNVNMCISNKFLFSFYKMIQKCQEVFKMLYHHASFNSYALIP